ncbi:MAG: Bug family tripartite tricarboxylate transporter substrate binding protein [Thiohalobacterales bacterium]
MSALSRKLALFPAALVAAAALGTTTTAVQAAEWTPKKPVEFVIMAGPGGGADKMARLMQTIIEKHKFSPKPFIPVNKPGGSGAEALIYLKGKKKDNHVVMVTLNSFYTTPLRQPKLGVDPLQFAPIARMAEDTFILWVHKDSGITNIDEFVAAAKKAGSGWIMAGTGKGGEDELLTSFLNQTYGLKIRYVPFKGGGRVAKELAGKHANSTVNNPSEALGFYESGDVVPIVTFTDERLPLFPDTPTMSEVGKPYAYYMQRSVVGTSEMSDEAYEFYRGVFKKVYDSEEWQAYMKKKSLLGEFLTGDDLRDYWKVNNETHKKLLREIGEIK